MTAPCCPADVDEAAQERLLAGWGLLDEWLEYKATQSQAGQ